MPHLILALHVLTGWANATLAYLRNACRTGFISQPLAAIPRAPISNRYPLPELRNTTDWLHYSGGLALWFGCPVQTASSPKLASNFKGCMTAWVRKLFVIQNKHCILINVNIHRENQGMIREINLNYMA
jgi:hypothetical protein